MRIGATLLLKDGLACQSHGWNYYRPIGPLSEALSALTRYQIDEVNVICLDHKDGRNLSSSIEILANCACSTPLTFGGGITSNNVRLILDVLPAERYSFCSSLISNELASIKAVSKTLGLQSVVGCMPVRLIEDQLEIYHPTNGVFVSLSQNIQRSFADNCDEVIVYDVESDGQKTGFNFDILDKLSMGLSKTIISGGVRKTDVSRANEFGLNAIHVDNSCLHFENGGTFK